MSRKLRICQEQLVCYLTIQRQLHGQIYQNFFMAIPARGKKERPFPALVVVSLLFLVCLFAAQYLISNLPPGIPGLATVHPGLVVFDIPIQLPLSIDGIVVPALFFLAYGLVLLLYPSGNGTTWRQTVPRLKAVFAGSLIFLFAAASGGFLSYWVHDLLPKNVRNGIDSLGISAEISLPFSALKMIHLPGNVITLVGLLIGFAIAAARIGKTPGPGKTAPLTREQRMTPYERMQREKKQPAAIPKTAPATTVGTGKTATKTSTPGASPVKTATKPRCQNHPLHSLEPEAVAYMPMR
jgi:hypothetical protein